MQGRGWGQLVNGAASAIGTPAWLRSPAFLAWAAAAVLLAALHYAHDIRHYSYDAGEYWLMATVPGEVWQGRWIRGYLLPLLLGSLLDLGSLFGLRAGDAFRLSSAAAYAAVLTQLLPATLHRLTGTPTGFARRLAPALLLALVFPGALLYPLSDVPALAFMWLCVYCLLRCRDEAAGNGAAARWALAAGAAAGAAYNIRSIYLFSVVLVLLVALVQFKNRRRAAWALAGFVLIGLPQLAINQSRHGLASINPAAAIGDRSLFVQQLNGGLSMQRYETSIAPGVPPQVVYADPAGRALRAKICEAGSLDSVTDYAAAVAQHPIAFAGLYARHFINMLDVRDAYLYVQEPSSGKTLRGVASITLLLAMLLAIRSAWRVGAFRGQRANWVYPLAFMLPTLAQVPGAIETRYAIPLYVLLFAAGTACWSWPLMTAELRSRWAVYLGSAAAALALFFVVTQNTMASVDTNFSGTGAQGCTSLNIPKT